MGDVLFEFKVGRMTAKPQGQKKHRVEGDPRKGKLCLVRSNDGMVHLMWKLRPANTVEEDMLVFPDNQTFSKVNTGRDDDRVYLLQFNGSSRRFFFWMQEPKKEDDEENARKLNEYMNNPPEVGMGGVGEGGDDQDAARALMQYLSQFQGGGAAGGGSGRPLQVGDLSSVLQGMNLPQQQGRNNSSGDGNDDNEDESKSESKNSEEKKDNSEGTTTTTTTTARPGGTGQLTQEDLQRAFAGVQSAMSQMQTAMTPPLSEIVQSNQVLEIISNEEVQEGLLPLLPEGRQTMEELLYTISSPQLRQALGSLSHALQSDNFNSIMSNVGLNPMDGASYLQRGDGIGAFLAALQAQLEKEKDGNDYYN